ncbi:Hypothetical predicted protein [Xyrichtys novacula]|uniref:Uncharacterized protein n=1 Tax=Xyrichtys novacula TaxID=13765 RepID=A0AAV1HRL8_XYRNO|nr:Hypothetical predicted protein [Xyrichtys novacula]
MSEAPPDKPLRGVRTRPRSLSEFPAARDSRAKETLTDVFFLSPDDDEEPLTRSTPAPRLLTRASCRRLPAQAVTREDAGIRCSDSPITTGSENVSHTNTHLDFGSHTHLLVKPLPGTAEGAGLVCTEQMYETGGKK